jgi:hypothetical protein
MKKRPRADMAGFIPWEEDRQRMAHLKKYRAIEAKSRKALRNEVVKPEM